MRILKYYWSRWKTRKEWWVVRYYIKSRGEVKQSGSFAEFGTTFEEACENAERFVLKEAHFNGECFFTVQRPSILEALFGLIL